MRRMSIDMKTAAEFISEVMVSVLVSVRVRVSVSDMLRARVSLGIGGSSLYYRL